MFLLEGKKNRLNDSQAECFEELFPNQHTHIYTHMQAMLPKDQKNTHRHTRVCTDVSVRRHRAFIFRSFNECDVISPQHREQSGDCQSPRACGQSVCVCVCVVGGCVVRRLNI